MIEIAIGLALLAWLYFGQRSFVRWQARQREEQARLDRAWRKASGGKEP